MTLERGPLPPLPEPKDYGMSPGTWDASDMHAYAIDDAKSCAAKGTT